MIKVNSEIKKMGPSEKPMESIGGAHKVEEKKLDKPREKKCHHGFLSGLVTLIVLAMIVFGALHLVSRYTSWNILGMPKATTDWQAVFLSNGQVYFGHVEQEGSHTLVLKDIYYLQVSNALQRSQDQTGPQQQRGSELSLVKLGNELHGPVDAMRINRDHILFVEDLKMDGKVVQAILTHKSGGTAQPEN